MNNCLPDRFNISKMSNTLEATARIKINKLLEESGWRFFDNSEGKANIALESSVKYEDHK